MCVRVGESFSSGLREASGEVERERKIHSSELIVASSSRERQVYRGKAISKKVLLSPTACGNAFILTYSSDD